MVIALDRHKKPMGLVTERRCRKLVEAGRGVVFRHYPMTLIVKDADVRDMESIPSYRIKIDPGAVHTGIAIVCNETNEALFYMQIEHRGQLIRSNLQTRNGARRNRRQRETRYRRCRFVKNIKAVTSRSDGWLPPSVKSIGSNIISWVKKLMKLINITECSFEAVRFDTQLMDNPDIGCEEYQHGTLYGYELREYLMHKFRHTCQYCGGASGDGVLEWEHMTPRSRGGSDSVKNASLACRECNKDKDNHTLAEYLEIVKRRSPKSAKAKELNAARINCISSFMKGGIKGSDRYAAWSCSLRTYEERELYNIFDENHMECSSGGRTKMNRTVMKLPKDHHYDALSVGSVPEEGYTDRTKGYVLYAKAMGRGTRFRGKINQCGIIIKKLTARSKRVFGFMNGDIVKADVPADAKSKYKGIHVGRVMTRASGSFDIRREDGKLVTVNRNYCKIIQYGDGYSYSNRRAIPLGC